MLHKRRAHYDEAMNLGMPEMIFIFLLALVVFGPRKLPELGRQLGKALAEFKRASNEFKNQLEVEMMNIELEERARKESPRLPDPEENRTILPVEKLYETTAPPEGAVSRSSLTESNPPSADLTDQPVTAGNDGVSESAAPKTQQSASPNA